MSDKPFYYGSESGKGPMHYGSSKAPGYGGSGPMYYGAGRRYGAYGNYGSYGQYGAYGQYGEDNSSVIGTITLSRVLRVLSQRWLSVFVFVLIGLIVSFAVYRISPTIYSATTEFTMDIRRTSGRNTGAIDMAIPDYGNTYAEIFNTRISDWRSSKVFAKIIEQYRTKNPASTASEEEILEALVEAEIELQRNSRIITISVRSTSPQMCAALANAYAQAIETFTDEENKIRCDRAVSQIHANVEKARRKRDKIQAQVLDFRTAHKVDSMRAARESMQLRGSQTDQSILELESEEAQLIEWEKMLSAVQQDPTSYGSLSVSVPRAQEIAMEFKAFQDADGEYQKLLFAYTENHPDVISKKKEMELSRQRFLDAANRALQTGRSTLKVTRNQLANLRRKKESLSAELSSLEQRIALAEESLKSLDRDAEMANNELEGLVMNENNARIEAENNNEMVRVGRPANVPEKPVLPNPLVIFGLGIAVSVLMGVGFVLVIDNLEDTVVNLSDIEGRLALKVLAVLPHLRNKKRKDVARSLIDEQYSQFSESIAGLRNLFDSPRYEAMAKCILFISTQPGEGKTITSTSLAISYAQSGKKTLHVDFDLRRPKVAGIWGLELTEERSFSHKLQFSIGKNMDFSSLVNRTELDNLDIVASLPPSGITPSQIFGSGVVAEFFDWARANYDRIIVDAPPYGVVGDVVTLAMLVDSTVIMCCPDRTHFRPIQHCSRYLTEAGANILGVIVNDVEVAQHSAFAVSSHMAYGKYNYGYGYSYVKHSGSADGDDREPGEFGDEE